MRESRIAINTRIRHDDSLIEKQQQILIDFYDIVLKKLNLEILDRNHNGSSNDRSPWRDKHNNAIKTIKCHDIRN